MSQAADIGDFVSISPSSARESELGSVQSLRTWTVPRLIAELQRRGISYPASARKAQLFRLLFPRTADSSAEQVTLRTVAASLAEIHTTLSSLATSCHELRSRVEVLENQPSPVSAAAAAGPVALADSGSSSIPGPVSVGPGNNLCAPSVNPAHFIPANIRKDILEGKDVNLASLLIAAHDVADNRSYACGDVSVVVKTRDHRLSRKLSIPEFVLAFSLYRDVICSVTPLRREELDLYLYTVVELGHKYGGSYFYDYHRSFSAKAAARFAQFQVVTVWSNMDTELFCRHFAGLRSPVCASCQSSSHTAYWCPNWEVPAVPSTSRGSGLMLPSSGHPAPLDKLGRPIHFLGKSQICNNYNLGVCNFSQCRLLHICTGCFRAHPKSACSLKQSKTS